MGDVGEEYLQRNEVVRQNKETRRQENLEYLDCHNIAWDWVDRASDHILINGEIDYYLGKTYWFNRKTKKHGYAMLSKLFGEGV